MILTKQHYIEMGRIIEALGEFVSLKDLIKVRKFIEGFVYVVRK